MALGGAAWQPLPISQKYYVWWSGVSHSVFSKVYLHPNSLLRSLAYLFFLSRRVPLYYECLS